MIEFLYFIIVTICKEQEIDSSEISGIERLKALRVIVIYIDSVYRLVCSNFSQ